MTFDDQNVAIAQNVQLLEKKVTKVAKQGVTSKPKTVSRKYFLNGKVVCKELFLSTYAIANGRLQQVTEKVHKNLNTAPKGWQRKA